MESRGTLRNLPDTSKGILELGPYALAERRQRHAGALEQFSAEFVFKVLDTDAQGRLGHPAAPCRPRKVALIA